MKRLGIILALCLALECKNSPLETLLLPDHGTKPTILATYPSDGVSRIDPTEQIWVLFDREMDTQKTQSSFSLTSEKQAIVGSFKWEHSKMIFIPKQFLSGSDELTMIVGKGSETQLGIDLGEDYLVRFHTQNDIIKPLFLSSTPTNGEIGVDPSTDILLRFSKPIDFSSIPSGLSISPSTQHIVSQEEDGSLIRLHPSSPLVYGTRYKVHLNGRLTDRTGNSLARDVIISFMVGDDFERPYVEEARIGNLVLENALLVSGAQAHDSIVIQFSKEMEVLSTEDAISISPSHSFQKVWSNSNRSLEILFDSPLESETNYSLSLGNTAIDQNGNAILQGYEYRFFTNGGESLRPVITSVRQVETFSSSGFCAGIQPSGMGPALQDLWGIDMQMRIDLDPGVTELCAIRLRVDFSNPIERNSLARSISIGKVFSGSIGSLVVYGVSMDGDPAQTHGSFAHIDLGPPDGLTWPGSSPGTSIFRFTIAGASNGIKDINGNVMISNFNLYFTPL